MSKRERKLFIKQRQREQNRLQQRNENHIHYSIGENICESHLW